MRVGLFFSCLYVFAALVRPQELFLELAPYHVMDILAALAVLTTTLDLVTGPRPVLTQPQVTLILIFVLWASFTQVLALQWWGGAWLSLQKQSTVVFVFLLAILHGSELRRLVALRRAVIFGLLLTIGLGLRAYYLGPRYESFVVVEKLPVVEEGAPQQESFFEDLTSRLTGRGAVDTSAGSESGEESQLRDPKGRPIPTIGRLRALGLLNDPNDLAQMLAAALPLVFLGWRPRRRLRNVAFVLVPASLILWAIALTRSRGGLVALAGLVYLWFASRQPPARARALRVSGFVALIVLLIVFFRQGADGSAWGRLQAWSEGLQMLKYSPVWGVGYMSFQETYKLVAHNSYVHCFSELGLVGYALWIAAIGSTLVLLARAQESEPDREGSAPGVGRWAAHLRLSLETFLVGAMFLSRSYSVTLFLLLGLATAVTGVALRTTDEPRTYALQPFSLAAWTGAATLATVALTYGVVVLGGR